MLLLVGFFYFVFPISPKASLLALLCGECPPKQLSKREVGHSCHLFEIRVLAWGLGFKLSETWLRKLRVVMSSACVALKLWQCCDITKALSSETCCFVLFHPFTFFYLLAPVTLASAAESLVSVVLMCKAGIKLRLYLIIFILFQSTWLWKSSTNQDSTQRPRRWSSVRWRSWTRCHIPISSGWSKQMGWGGCLVVRWVG